MIEVAGINWRSDSCGKDQAPFLPSPPCKPLLLSLPYPSGRRAQTLPLRKLDGHSAILRFGFNKTWLTVNALQFGADGQEARTQINVLPSKSKDFSLAQSERDSHREERFLAISLN
jgi:hypothetical protein